MLQSLDFRASLTNKKINEHFWRSSSQVLYSMISLKNPGRFIEEQYTWLSPFFSNNADYNYEILSKEELTPRFFLVISQNVPENLFLEHYYYY